MASGHPLFEALLEHGREAHSVEAESLGFDLRSCGPDQVRYIEVKGRLGSGGVTLTANEWIKADRFGKDYWLYVVHGCGSDSPRLTLIRDSAATLAVVEETITAARFRVNAGKITRRGTRADEI